MRRADVARALNTRLADVLYPIVARESRTVDTGACAMARVVKSSSQAPGPSWSAGVGYSVALRVVAGEGVRRFASGDSAFDLVADRADVLNGLAGFRAAKPGTATLEWSAT
jgi:hypothetical protein